MQLLLFKQFNNIMIYIGQFCAEDYLNDTIPYRLG